MLIGGEVKRTIRESLENFQNNNISQIRGIKDCIYKPEPFLKKLPISLIKMTAFGEFTIILGLE